VNVIQIEFWTLVEALGACFVALVAGGWVLVEIIIRQFTLRLDERQEAQAQLREQREKALDVRFTSLEKSIRDEGDGWRTVERELLQLKADLPVQYMRREDAIRQEVVIHAKLDSIAAQIYALRGEK